MASGVVAGIRHSRIFGFLVWGLCVFFFLYEFFLRTVVGTFQSSLMTDLQLSSFRFSVLSTTSYMLVYGLMQIPVSIIVDSVGLKKSLVIGSFACAIAAIGLANAHQFETAVAFRGLMGFGSSFGYICLLISVYDWMPRKYNGLFIGISQFLGTMGPLIAAGPLSSLAGSAVVSWRSVFVVMSGIGFGLMLLIWLFVENNQEEKGSYRILRPSEGADANVRRLFSSSQAWMISIFCACTYFSIEYLSENEGISFIAQKGFSPKFGASMISLTWLGFAIGNPLLGLISDLIQRRKTVMVIASLSCLVGVSGIVYSQSAIVLTVAFFLLGIGASGQSIGVAAISDHFKKHFIAIGYGLNNALVTTAVAVNAPCIGFLLDTIKKGEHPNLAEYTMAFNSLIVLSVISLVFSVFLVKESFCKSKVDFTYLKVR